MPGQNLNKNVGSPHKKHQHFVLLPRGFFDKGYVQRQQVGVGGVVHWADVLRAWEGAVESLTASPWQELVDWSAD